MFPRAGLGREREGQPELPGRSGPVPVKSVDFGAGSRYTADRGKRGFGGRLDRQFSTYLNVLRVFAALAVVASHVVEPRFSGTMLDATALPGFGHHAVLIFFVLSGYVIASAVERTPTLSAYLVARLARMFSVVLPMLLVVPILDWFGRRIEPGLYIPMSPQDMLNAVLSALTFSHEYWLRHIRYFSNEPFWSLSFEVTYYILFGFAFYLRGWTRAALLALTMIAAGPKIALLLPTWLAGVYLYRSRDPFDGNMYAGGILFLAPILIYALGIEHHLFKALNRACQLGWIYLGIDAKPLSYGRNPLTDYVLCGLVAANLVGARMIFRAGRLDLSWAKRPVDWLADGSFALYLFHLPIMLAVGAAMGGSRATPSGAATLAMSGIAGALLLAEISDRRRRWWVSMFERMLPFRRASTARSVR